MKKIMNNKKEMVNDMLEGQIFAYKDILERVENTNIIIRKKKKKNKVGVVSGGGSGHEPAHSGYVGMGMLDAAIAGEIFTSPSPDQIFKAIKLCNSGKGVLLIIKNYSGDNMNFNIAEKLAKDEGINVAKIIVNDDIVGNRGIAGTVLIHKIAGAMAERGEKINEVLRIAKKAVKNIKSVGIALKPCVLPMTGKNSFDIDEDEMEVGLGIHGEPGIKKEKIMTANKIAKYLFNELTKTIVFKENMEIALMINGLGGTPLMELFILNKEFNLLFKEKNIKVFKNYVNNYMTSLEMAGASCSILSLDKELKSLLCDMAYTPAFIKGIN